jgi:hypothetical protein
MDFLTTLWLPILLSAIFVFIISSIIHMVLKYHSSDFKKLPNEDGAMDALRELDMAPGTYMVPCPGSSAERRSEEFQAKVKKGPVVFMTVRSADMKMTQSLVQWFVYCIVISIFAAYLGVHAVGPEADYLDVFRFVGCAAFMGYSLALIQDGIWLSKSWSSTWKSVFDGLIYALVTAGTFGWLWP